MKTKPAMIQFLVLALLALNACGEAQTGTPGKPLQPLVGTPSPVFSDILFFATDNIYLGNMGGREGVDEVCNTEKPAEADGRQVRAYISVDADDSVGNMPANYDIPTDLPIVTTLDIQLGVDWADLLDSSIAAPLSVALPNMPATTYYWTGTWAAGQSGSAPCDGWTSTSGGADAGSSDEIDGQWLSVIGSICSFGRKVLCVAY